MPRAFGGTRSLTHSVLINLFIKVRLIALLLPPLLGITFVRITWSYLKYEP